MTKRRFGRQSSDSGTDDTVAGNLDLIRVHRCAVCSATETPQWREGPTGPKTLCNACGVKWLRQLKRQREGLTPTKSAGGRHSSIRSLATTESSDEMNWTTHRQPDDTLDERDAALNLLSFAAAPASSVRSSPKMIKSLPVTGHAQPHFLPAADVQHKAAAHVDQHQRQAAAARAVQPKSEATEEEGDGAESLSFRQNGFPGLDILPPGISEQEMRQLQQLHRAVLMSQKELQAADAARRAVEQCLTAKQKAAAKALAQAVACARDLHSEMCNLDAMYGLSSRAAGASARAEAEAAAQQAAAAAAAAASQGVLHSPHGDARVAAAVAAACTSLGVPRPTAAAPTGQ